MTVARIRPVFDELRAGLTPLVARIAARAGRWTTRRLRKHFRASAAVAVRGQGDPVDWLRLRARAAGSDGASVHDAGSVMATRASPRARTRTSWPNSSSAPSHEAGHALYEQGTRAEDDGLPLGSGTSAGVHESQSRLWENIVGRSLGFWSHWYPTLQEEFPEQLGGVDPARLLRGRQPGGAVR